MLTTLIHSLISVVLLMGAATAAGEPSMSAETKSGLYSISIRPQDGEIPIAERHVWVVSIQDRDGRAVQPEQLAFYGGMRGHGHGLPSTPRVTQELEPGSYSVEGVVFNMYGDWEIVVGVVGPAGPDKVLFELAVVPPIDDDQSSADWSPRELALMRSLELPRSIEPPGDSSNRYAGRTDAIALGQALFFDAGLSLNGDLSCASCHEPRLFFTDGKQKSMGSRELMRNSPTLLGVAHGDWFYWDGRRDSLWAQSLTPIETPGEMDGNRLGLVRYVMTQRAYAEKVRGLIDDLPDLKTLPETAGPYSTPDDKARWSALTEGQRRRVNAAFSAVGKIIASYVATLEPAPSRFDAYVASQQLEIDDPSPLSPAEIRGLRLFLNPDKTQCLRCHNGPYFTNFGFNNIGTGVAVEDEQPDFGRMIGLQAALVDEFNCVGRYSDAGTVGCGHHRYAAQGHADNGAFKVPTLRNVAKTGPYMHDGRFENLPAVLEYYRDPPPKALSNHELPPLELSDEELRDLASFLAALTGTTDP